MRNLELEQQLTFCEKYGISPNELLLLEILLVAQEGDGLEIVNRYFSSRVDARGKVTELLLGLQNAGIINKTYKVPEKGYIFNPLDVPLNKNIVKDFYKCSFEIGKELWETYPLFGIVNNSQVGIRSISKKFDSLEDFYRFYGKTIRWKPDIHNHIIDLVKWAKEHNLLCTTLANFVVDHRWEELEALRGEGGINYDTMKLL